MSDSVADIPPFTPEALEEVSLMVQVEIANQDRQARDGRFHGTHIMPGGPDDDRLKILGAEVGEVNLALKEIRYGVATREGELRDELIQVAAVAQAWAVAILEDRP